MQKESKNGAALGCGLGGARRKLGAKALITCTEVKMGLGGHTLSLRNTGLISVLTGVPEGAQLP